MPASRPLAAARTTLTPSCPPDESGPASASAGGRSALSTVISARSRPATAARPFGKASPSGPATPSWIHTTVLPGVLSRKAVSAGRCAARSARCGSGSIARRRSRAGPGPVASIPVGPEAVGRSATGRPARAAASTSAVATRRRSRQSWAAENPLSRMRTRGARPSLAACGVGFQTGPDTARIRQAAASSRSASSQGGVRAGVSRSGSRSARMRSGGKSIRRGRGGVTRSRYHSAGSAMRAARAAGAAKPRGSPNIEGAPQPAPRAAATRVTRRKAASLAGRSVRCRVSVQPWARTISPKASRWARIRRR